MKYRRIWEDYYSPNRSKPISRLNVLKEWLVECSTKHPHCKRISGNDAPQLPTRVLEISEDESNAPAADKEDIDPAVWYESMVMSESVGVGAWAPVASGRAVRSSEPFGLCLGRMVRIEERDEASGVCETGWDRMTVVLYSECTEDVLSRRGRSLSLL